MSTPTTFVDSGVLAGTGYNVQPTIQRWSVKVADSTAAGTYTFHCSVHDFMRGSLVVGSGRRIPFHRRPRPNGWGRRVSRSPAAPGGLPLVLVPKTSVSEDDVLAEAVDLPGASSGAWARWKSSSRD